MHPWIIDANEMKAPQISVFQSNLLHPTRSIQRFLEPDSPMMIVVAPKGFGKTLLLKAKRLSLTDPSLTILPSGQSLLDKPGGSPSPPSGKEYADTRDNPAYWKNLWIISIAITILKHQDIHPKSLSALIERIFLEEKLKSPCDIFDALLSASYPEYTKAIASHRDKLQPEIRSVHNSICVFIDNIDESYEDMLRTYRTQVGLNMFGGAKEAYWYLSQLGLALASRELSELNSHLRIYASIRSEVKQRSITKSSFGIQLKSRSLEIAYTDGDLKSIIEKNILAEDKSNLFANTHSIIESFVGKDNLKIFHPKTGDEEDFIDFWIRHSLRRPRDIVSIGKHISDLSPVERNLRSLRQAVRDSSREVANAYMAEMAPHLAGFDPAILMGLIKSNTLSQTDVVAISKDYADAYKRRHDASVETHTAHVFCALYKIGLLGTVRQNGDSELVQEFVQSGSLSLDEVNILPDADLYLIHPILDDLIAAQSTKYFSNLNELNVIGVRRRWRDERAISYVLKGDLRNYSSIMQDSLKQRRFTDLLKSAAEQYCSDLDYGMVSGGDSILIADNNPVSVISAAQHIEQRISHSEFKGSFRFGGEAGYVMVDGSGDEQTVSGLSVRTAARLEPHVSAGEIWVTEEFVQRMRDQFSSEIYRFEEIDSDSAPSLANEEGRFNIAKTPRDDPIFTKLFRIQPL